MVGRLTLDQVVKVRILAPQPDRKPASGAGFRLSRSSGGQRGPHRSRASCRADWIDSTEADFTGEFNVYVYGTFAYRYVEVSDGPVICSTV